MVYIRWLQLEASIKLYVSFAKEPYKRDNTLYKRPIILSILLTVATPYVYAVSPHTAAASPASVSIMSPTRTHATDKIEG